jgi:hypothetical protein
MGLNKAPLVGAEHFCASGRLEVLKVGNPQQNFELIVQVSVFYVQDVKMTKVAKDEKVQYDEEMRKLVGSSLVNRF